MMKKGIALTAVLTVVIVLAGFFMPSLVSIIQDSKNHTEVEGFPSVDASLSFSHDMSLPEKLATVAAGIDYAVKAADTESAGYEKVVSELQRLVTVFENMGYDIFEGGNVELLSLSPYIAVCSDENDTTMRIWQCELAIDDGVGNIALTFDDETGYLLSLNYVNEKKNYEWMGAEGAYVLASCYSLLYEDILKDYEISIEPVIGEYETESKYDQSISAYDDFSSVAKIVFKGTGEAFEIISVSRHNMLIFNYS